MTEEIRRIVSGVPKIGEFIATMADDADLWDAGMESMASVQLMMQLEDHFGVEIPEEKLTRETFSSIRAIEAVLTELLHAPERSGQHAGKTVAP
ncbi:acyl carrier protein [Kitasatospora sp. NPDC058965]|uniref:acyl carrier protein n=1 Tax=Kitasatospora sp. NPDC058965 TaxID=3346682 RepID=UPI003686A7AE